jgi:hypothetical protein
MAVGGQASRRSKSFLRSAKEALAALHACVKWAEHQANQAAAQPPSSYYRTLYTKDAQLKAAEVLKLGTKAVKLGVEGAAEQLQRLLLSVCLRPVEETTAAAALAAAAAAVLNAAVVGPALLQRVAVDMAARPNSCIVLIKGLAEQQQLQEPLAAAAVAAATGADVENLIALAFAVPNLPAVQQAAVVKAAAAVQGDASAALAGTAVPLLQQLQGLPQLQQQLAAAAVAAVPGSEVEQLVALALAVPDLLAVMQAAVAKAAVAVQNGLAVAAKAVPLLQQLQALPELQQQLAAAAAVAGLFNTQVQPLVALALAVPDLPDLQQAAVAKAAAAVQADPTGLLAVRAAPLLQRLQALPQLQQQLAAAGVAALRVAGPMEHCSTAVLLLQSCKGYELRMPREQLLGAICRETSSGRASSWQMTELQQLLQATPVAEGARAAMLAAAAQGMFLSNSSAVLQSRQTDDSMLLLSQLLLGDAGLTRSYYSRFATAVAQRRENYSLLKQLLQTAGVRAALELPGVQQLVSCQVANLQRLAAVAPFSWHMPQASVPSYRQVSCHLQDTC